MDYAEVFDKGRHGKLFELLGKLDSYGKEGIFAKNKPPVERKRFKKIHKNKTGLR